MFGGDDSDAYTGNLYSHEVLSGETNDFHWTLSYNGSTYNNKPLIGDGTLNVTKCIIDTGTSLLLLP